MEEQRNSSKLLFKKTRKPYSDLKKRVQKLQNEYRKIGSSTDNLFHRNNPKPLDILSNAIDTNKNNPKQSITQINSFFSAFEKKSITVAKAYNRDKGIARSSKRELEKEELPMALRRKDSHRSRMRKMENSGHKIDVSLKNLINLDFTQTLANLTKSHLTTKPRVNSNRNVLTNALSGINRNSSSKFSENRPKFAKKINFFRDSDSDFRPPNQ